MSLLLAACGSGSTTLIGGAVQPGYYLISGKIAGLPRGQQVILLNNGADPTTLTALGVFTFATPVARNGSYSVTVQTQPAGQVCSVSGGLGAGVTANIASVTAFGSAHRARARPPSAAPRWSRCQGPDPGEHYQSFFSRRMVMQDFSNRSASR